MAVSPLAAAGAVGSPGFVGGGPGAAGGVSSLGESRVGRPPAAELQEGGTRGGRGSARKKPRCLPEGRLCWRDVGVGMAMSVHGGREANDCFCKEGRGAPGQCGFALAAMNEQERFERPAKGRLALFPLGGVKTRFSHPNP